jgi:hypothetical protein
MAATVKTPKLTAQQAGAVATRVMGPRGPLRIFTELPFQGGMAYAGQPHEGYCGGYVCEGCLKVSDGLYNMADDRWFCAVCRAAKPRIKAIPDRLDASPAPKVGNVVTIPPRTPVPARDALP